MTQDRALAIDKDFSQLPVDPAERRKELLDCFGQFLFWLRNWALSATKTLVESDDAMKQLASIRRSCYEGVAAMPPEQREAAMLLVEETINGFGERLVWFLGGGGSDLRLGARHAVRFQVEVEIVELESNEVIERATITDGWDWPGKNWGRWLNRYGKGGGQP